jgi:hypothetical protein
MIHKRNRYVLSSSYGLASQNKQYAIAEGRSGPSRGRGQKGKSDMRASERLGNRRCIAPAFEDTLAHGSWAQLESRGLLRTNTSFEDVFSRAASQFRNKSLTCHNRRATLQTRNKVPSPLLMSMRRRRLCVNAKKTTTTVQDVISEKP